jgi:hypothetical protein
MIKGYHILSDTIKNDLIMGDLNIQMSKRKRTFTKDSSKKRIKKRKFNLSNDEPPFIVNDVFTIIYDYYLQSVGYFPLGLRLISKSHKQIIDKIYAKINDIQTPPGEIGNYINTKKPAMFGTLNMTSSIISVKQPFSNIYFGNGSIEFVPLLECPSGLIYLSNMYCTHNTQNPSFKEISKGCWISKSTSFISDPRYLPHQSVIEYDLWTIYNTYRCRKILMMIDSGYAKSKFMAILNRIKQALEIEFRITIIIKYYLILYNTISVMNLPILNNIIMLDSLDLVIENNSINKVVPCVGCNNCGFGDKVICVDKNEFIGNCKHKCKLMTDQIMSTMINT